MSKTDELLQRHGIAPPRSGALVGDGWLPLLDRLITDLIALGWDRQCDQVKEKFGGLRFYAPHLTQAMWERIDAADKEAWRTCDVCGAEGTTVNQRGWLRTVCAAHAAERSV